MAVRGEPRPSFTRRVAKAFDRWSYRNPPLALGPMWTRYWELRRQEYAAMMKTHDEWIEEELKHADNRIREEG